MEIKLSAPLVEVVCPEEAAAADERVAVVDVIEYCGSHAAVAWGCGEVVGMGTEDAFETAVFAARVEREEITFALEAGDVGIFGEQVLVCGVEQPGCATDRFEGTVGEVFGKKFGDLAEGIAAIFKFHWSVFGDVNFEDGVTFDEDAIPAGTREANWLALCMAVGVNGIAGDMGRGFGVFGCPGIGSSRPPAPLKLPSVRNSKPDSHRRHRCAEVRWRYARIFWRKGPILYCKRPMR